MKTKPTLIVLLFFGLLLTQCSNFIHDLIPRDDPAAVLTITFDKNGGTTEAGPATKTVTYQDKRIDALPTAPYWDTGHTFKGWWTKNGYPDGTVEANWGTAFTDATEVTANITVYARWTPPPITYLTVTFDKNGGDTEADPQTRTAAPGGTVTLPDTEPTRAGYTFYGWYTSSNNGATLGDAFTEDTPVTTDMTVYAKWEAGRPIIYVRPPRGPGDATPYGKGDGTSWKNAYVDLQLAINLAAERAAAGTTGTMVWAAAGNYYPWRTADMADKATGRPGDPAPPIVPPTNRDNAFVFLPNVDVYGGFAGNEPGASVVPPVGPGNRSLGTILSGDLNASGGIDGADAYHVVVVADVPGSGSYDGFTIQGGNANGAGSIAVRGKAINRNNGGGLYLVNSMPTLRNVTIQSNVADAMGGGIYLYNSTPGTLTLSHVKVLGNRVLALDQNGTMGGTIYATGSNGSFTFVNVLIAGNVAVHASGMYIFGIPATLINVTIAGNTGDRCQAIHAESNVLVRNSISVGSSWGDVITVHNSFFTTKDNTSYAFRDPGFVSLVTPADITSPTLLGDYHLKPTANAVINQGNNAFINGLVPAVTTDLDLKPRIAGGTVDMGCYEYQ